MKVENLDYTFMYLDGKPVLKPILVDDGPNDPRPPLTLRSAIVIALQSGADTKNVDAEKKIIRNDLAERVFFAKGSIDLTAEEIVLIKNLVNQVFGVLVTAKAHKILDPPIKPS